MSDQVRRRPARKFAGAAVFASVCVHALLFLGLLFIAGQNQEPVPALSANDLVVVVGEEDRDRGNGGRPDVILMTSERPNQSEVGPFSQVTQPHVVDPAPNTTSADPSTDPVPRVRGPAPRVDNSAPGNGTGDGGASFFGTSASGRTVLYVLDRSMSMGVHDGLRQARAELLASLSRLPPATQFQVIPYNQIAEPLSVHNYSGLLTADAETLAEVTRSVEALRATGRTNHVQALLSGLKFRPDVLFFVTDADELSVKDVDDVSLYNGGRCSIHVIDLSPRPDDSVNALRRLALQNRGTYRHVGVKEL